MSNLFMKGIIAYLVVNVQGKTYLGHFEYLDDVLLQNC